jgi:sugar lactone lactonase YvrE
LLSLAAVAVTLGSLYAAESRAQIGFTDGKIFPESLTSTKNGTVYFGANGQDAVYRAVPDAAQASVWIKPKSNGLQTVLGVFADEKAGTLWVCTSQSGGRGGAPVVGETALKAFSLKDASFRASYTFPGGNGLCNDIAVAKDGTVYATDTTQARVLRLKKNAKAFETWASDKMLLAGADGIAILSDGNVYVNSVTQSTLMRIPMKKDGSAGPIEKLELSQPVMGPDGMRSIGGMKMLLVEGGKLDEVTISSNKAEIKTIKGEMPGITAVTLVGNTAFVSEARLNDRTKADPGPFRAIGVPYTSKTAK